MNLIHKDLNQLDKICITTTNAKFFYIVVNIQAFLILETYTKKTNETKKHNIVINLIIRPCQVINRPFVGHILCLQQKKIGNIQIKSSYGPTCTPSSSTNP